MANTERINEIVAQITAFRKDTYRREEVLPELFELQKQLIYLVFNGTHAEFGQLRIWDLEKHFRKLNEECGHIADSELEKVLSSCKIICNLIKSKLSGEAGERKAFWSLQTVGCKNRVLKNIELKLGDHRAELDAVMFTSKAIFIIEVKNSKKNICIDEKGNYFRVGNIMFLDQNIGEKMNDKTSLLRNALSSSGIERLNIVNVVVFSNSTIKVDNSYPYINICHLGNLPHFIEQYSGDDIYTDADMDKMAESVALSECKESYPLPIDIEQFKIDFATVMAMLEEATAKMEENVDESTSEKTEEALSTPDVEEPACEKSFLHLNTNRSNAKNIIIAGATFTLTAILSACIGKALVNKGGFVWRK